MPPLARLALAAQALQAQQNHPTDRPQWRYLFTDLLTDNPLALVPMSGVQMSRRISAAGDLTGTIAVPNADVANQVKKIIAQRTACYAMRSLDGSTFLPWWGGIVWTPARASGTNGAAQVSISAATFESFLGRGYLEEDLADLTDVEQLDIARTLWNERQRFADGNINVQLGTETSGILRDRTEYRVANKVNLGQALDDLANVIDGFEYTIEVFLDGGERKKLLRLGYPELSPDGPMPLFTMGPGGGRLLKWTDSPDGTAGDTVFYARGAAPDSDVTAEVEPPVSTAVPAQDLLDAGWPRLVRMDDYSTVSDVDTLTDHAEQIRDLYQGAVNTFSATVSVVGTDWTPAKLGATHRFKIDDAFWQGQELQHRVVGFTIHPPERGQAETVDLIFETTADEDRLDNGVQ